MSLVKDNIWKLLVPLAVISVMFFIPAPGSMLSQAWHYFAMFVAMIVGMILEPAPVMTIGFTATTTCVIGSNYLLFDARELADLAFNAQKQALGWGLTGFSSTTVQLVFSAFIFASGYEVSGLDRHITLFLVKLMDKRTLMLGYAIVVIDILLAPFTPSNTARTEDTALPVTKNLPPLLKSFPNDPSMHHISGYLTWTMITSTSLSSFMFVTGAAPNVLGPEFVSEIAGTQISRLQWFLCFLPVGVILLIIALWLPYVLYKPGITHSEGVATWADGELRTMSVLTRREWMLIGPILLSLGLQVFGSRVTNATAVDLLAVSLMLALHVVPWRDITCYNSARNALADLATLVATANGLTRSGFIDWFANTMSTYLEDFLPDTTVIVLVLAFYFAHYLFAGLSAHTTTMLPVTLVVGKGIPDVLMERLCILLVLSIGIVGCLTPYITGLGVIIHDCDYVKSKDYWRPGTIFGVIYIPTLPLVGQSILAMWNQYVRQTLNKSSRSPGKSTRWVFL